MLLQALTIRRGQRSSAEVALQPMRLLWALHALCSLGLALAPLVRQGDYLVDAWILHRYRELGIANLAPLAACVVGSLSGLAGWLDPHSRLIRALREFGVLVGMLLVTLTYLEARQHILMFSSICVAGDGNRPDPSASILPTFVLSGALLTHALLATATWLRGESAHR